MKKHIFELLKLFESGKLFFGSKLQNPEKTNAPRAAAEVTDEPAKPV